LQDIGVTYGGIVALAHVSFAVPQHAIVGLIGPNGAGKTTLVDAICGFTPCEGSLELDGRVLDGLQPHQRVRAGLGRTFQGQELWADLSVAENVLVGHGAHQRSPAELDQLFDLLQLVDVRDRLAGELSQGQRQMVSIARSLVRNPTVLLLDEPGAGLDSTESAWLADRLRRIRDGGVTIVLIDHDMDLVLGVCDRVEVLDLGRIIASDTPAAIRTNPLVAEAYLGDADVPATAPTSTETLVP
jgi:ABC-type branched-subunit amino acid transport system ATPase component